MLAIWKLGAGQTVDMTQEDKNTGTFYHKRLNA
jgi:hypothetical protein